MKKELQILLLLLLLTVLTLQQSSISLTDVGQTGVPLNQMTCNAQTIIEFKFNTSSSITTINPPVDVSSVWYRPFYHTVTLLSSIAMEMIYFYHWTVSATTAVVQPQDLSLDGMLWIQQLISLSMQLLSSSLTQELTMSMSTSPSHKLHIQIMQM